jgi:hypothetical protein
MESEWTSDRRHCANFIRICNGESYLVETCDRMQRILSRHKNGTWRESRMVNGKSRSFAVVRAQSQ